MNTSPPDKAAIRTRMLALRAEIPASAAESASRSVADSLLKIIPANAVIAGYRAIRGELVIAEAMAQLAARGNALCLPVVQAPGKPLAFHAWKPGEILEKGHYGVEVPAAAALVTPTIVLVPLVAFDRAGHRLGYGAGYYDRTIESLRQAGNAVQMIGIGYGLQEVPHVAPESHDQKLDVVVTEKEILRFA